MRLLTVNEVTNQLQISRTLVYRLVEQGKLGCHRIGTGRGAIRFSQTDIDAFLDSCRVEPGEKAREPKLPRAQLKHLRI